MKKENIEYWAIHLRTPGGKPYTIPLAAKSEVPISNFLSGAGQSIYNDKHVVTGLTRITPAVYFYLAEACGMYKQMGIPIPQDN